MFITFLKYWNNIKHTGKKKEEIQFCVCLQVPVEALFKCV